MTKFTENLNLRTRTMQSFPYLPSLQIWLKKQIGVFTHCAVASTSMLLILGKTVIATDTVRITSSRQLTVKVSREIKTNRARLQHLAILRNEETTVTKPSQRRRTSLMLKMIQLPWWRDCREIRMEFLRLQPSDTHWRNCTKCQVWTGNASCLNCNVHW